jgi:hypothetical protein
MALAFVRPLDPVFRQDVILAHQHSVFGWFHTWRDALGTFAHNLLALAGFAIVAALLAGWPPVRRRVGVFLAAALLGYTLFALARQSAIVMRLFAPDFTASSGGRPAVPYAELPLLLPHGSLELGALVLPLLVALRGSRRSVLAILPLSIALLAAAAAVETWVSPGLLQRAVWGA